MNFGFSYIGLIWLIMLFVPNFIWTKNKPQDYEEYVQNENKVLLMFERAGQCIVTTAALIFSDFNYKGWNLWLPVLGLSFLCMVLYELFWIRYFRSEKTMKDFYRSFCGIPVAGASLPVVAFFLLGIYGGNILMLAGAVILGIGHIGIHLQHQREVYGPKEKKPNKLTKVADSLKTKTAPAAEFMENGRAGAMIAEVILGSFFVSWMIESFTYGRIPAAVCFLIGAALIAAAAEVLNLVLKIVFGAGKRCKSYFFIVAFAVSFSAIGANQMSEFLFAYGCSFLLTLAVDISARIICGFVRTGRFKQVFAYVALALSLIYIVAFAVFFFGDSFGKSRVDFYNRIEKNEAAQAEGFGEFLKDGPYEVTVLSYGPEADADNSEAGAGNPESDADIVTETLDYTVFNDVQDLSPLDVFEADVFSDYDLAKTPVKGQIWYPAGKTGCPVFFMVHGNHDSTVPSYLGYEYLGNYLASHGFVMVSVDENIINCTGAGNDLRAILLLDNMKEIFRLNRSANSPLSGLIDETKVAIGGHSRGGEMAATAYLFNDLDKYPEDGNISFDYHYDITSIVAIAPCVDQYRPVNWSVEISDVNYLVIHGANDQDVSSMSGEKQYNNVTFSEDPDNFRMKSSVYILGANHGQFNSRWGRYDSEGTINNFLNTANFLDESDQKLIAKAYIRAFLESTLNEDDTYRSLLSDVSGYRSYLPDTVYITNYYDSNTKMLCSFDDTVDIDHSGSGAYIECTGTKNWSIDTYFRGNGGEGDDQVLTCSWEKSDDTSKEITVKISFPAIDISEGSLSFAIADMRGDTEDMERSFGYSVELTDGKGNTVRAEEPTLVYPSLAVQLYKQDIITGSYEYKHQLQTVAVSPDSFDDPGFDFTDVVSMKIITDGTEDGEMIINTVAYQNGSDD